MPAGYIIAQVEITDPEAYEAYRAQVPATIAEYDGEYLARGGRFEGLEGGEPLGRTVILRFPSYEGALAWYHSEEYAGPRGIRQAASVSKVMVVEGME
ncbi:MAG: DUF1330 domain-containing protein [Alphaproteobacteria bacterium]|nr:DUF1330 domain-containing protein [Alphaproteobacteria bacterium]MDP6565256.1 DUF1330 domain-containing protein [Alphaproteobacteria bacterium]MDP6813632.1 DUF1330 domain-containing protein [Alphaproteobacteria bacterium]